MDLSAGGRVLALRVPLGEAVFFSVTTGTGSYVSPIWERREKKRKSSARRFWNMGSGGESDLILTNFYPELKHQVMDSWHRLLSHDQAIRKALSENQPLSGVQAGLWCIKKEWVMDQD